MRIFFFQLIGQLFEDFLSGQHVLMLAGAEHIQPQLAVKVAAGKTAAGEGSFQLLDVWFFAIQSLTEAGYSCPDIFRTFHAALDFQRVHTQSFQLFDAVHEGQVFQRESVAVIAAAAAEWQAAWLCAESAVAAALTDEGAHVALTGEAHTERAVDEDIHFHRYLLHHGLDFFGAHFAGQNHAGEAQLMHLFCAGDIVHRHLRGGVQRNIRCPLAQQFHNAQVLHQNGIDAVLAGRTDGFLQVLHLTVEDQCIEGHVHFHAAGLAGFRHLAELFFIKVFGVAAGIELTVAKVHRIGAAIQRSLQAFHAAGRSQNFQFAHKSPPYRAYSNKSPENTLGLLLFGFAFAWLYAALAQQVDLPFQLIDLPLVLVHFQMGAGGFLQILAELRAEMIRILLAFFQAVRIVQQVDEVSVAERGAGMSRHIAADGFVQFSCDGFDVVRRFGGIDDEFHTVDFNTDLVWLDHGCPQLLSFVVLSLL